MKKNILLFVLTLLSTLTTSAQTLIGGIYYNLNDKTKQAEVTSYDKKFLDSVIVANTAAYGKGAYSLTIPDTIKHDGVNYIVTSIGKDAFKKCSGMVEFLILGKVTTIGERAFSSCSDLKSIFIPSSVKSIGSGAFVGCTSLKTVNWYGERERGKREDWNKIIFADKYSDPTALENVEYREVSMTRGEKGVKFTSIKFTAPVIKKDDDDDDKFYGDTVKYKVNLQPSVIFNLGSAKIERSQIANVEMIAKFANKFKECKILVQGFAFCDDDTGTKTKKEYEDFHYKLSQKRADNVKEMLVKYYSIDADRIIAKGRGFTDKLFDLADFNRVVLFSAIDENGLEYVPTKVKSSVKFTAPVIKKDDDYNFYGDVVDNLSVVSFNGKSFKTVCHLEIPEAQDAQQYLSNLLFGEKNVGLKEAYGNFLKQWDRKDYTVATSVDGSINIEFKFKEPYKETIEYLKTKKL